MPIIIGATNYHYQVQDKKKKRKEKEKFVPKKFTIFQYPLKSPNNTGKNYNEVPLIF